MRASPTVDPDSLTGGWRHAIAEGADVVGVEIHGLFVPFALLLSLIGEALGLIDRSLSSKPLAISRLMMKLFSKRPDRGSSVLARERG